MWLENLIKYGLIIATYKIWWPILKTMWEELQVAMWREGGLIGREPTARELQVLEEKYGHLRSPMTSESYAQFKLREQREEAERSDRRRGIEPAQPAARRGSGNDVLQPSPRRAGPGQAGGPARRPAAGGPGSAARPRAANERRGFTRS